jgi:hypothetical protein
MVTSIWQPTGDWHHKWSICDCYFGQLHSSSGNSFSIWRPFACHLNHVFWDATNLSNHQILTWLDQNQNWLFSALTMHDQGAASGGLEFKSLLHANFAAVPQSIPVICSCICLPGIFVLTEFFSGCWSLFWLHLSGHCHITAVTCETGGSTYCGHFMSNNHNVDLATKGAILTSGFLQNVVPVVATSLGRSS